MGIIPLGATQTQGWQSFHMLAIDIIMFTCRWTRFVIFMLPEIMLPDDQNLFPSRDEPLTTRFLLINREPILSPHKAARCEIAAASRDYSLSNAIRQGMWSLSHRLVVHAVASRMRAATTLFKDSAKTSGILFLHPQLPEPHNFQISSASFFRFVGYFAKSLAVWGVCASLLMLSKKVLHCRNSVWLNVVFWNIFTIVLWQKCEKLLNDCSVSDNKISISSF